MRRYIVGYVLVPALRALKNPKEQLWLMCALATLLIIVAGSNGRSANSTASSAGSYYQSTQQNPPPPLAALASNQPFATYQGVLTSIPSITVPQVPSRPLHTAKLPEKPTEPEREDFAVIH